MITTEQACLNLLLQSFAGKIVQEWHSKYASHFGEVYQGLAYLPKGMKTKFLETIELDIFKTLQYRNLPTQTIAKLRPSIETIERILAHTEAMLAWETANNLPQAPNQVFWQIKPHNIQHKVRESLAYYLGYVGWNDFLLQHLTDIEQSQASQFPLVCIRREVRQESANQAQPITIYTETQWFQAQPAPEYPSRRKYNYLIISTLFVFLLLISLGIYWLNPLPKPSTQTDTPLVHIYTPAECAKIQFKILQADIGANRASFLLFYDFGDLPLPPNLTLTMDGDFDMSPNQLTKKSDTIQVQAYKPITQIVLYTATEGLFLQQLLRSMDTLVPTQGWTGFAHGDGWTSSYYEHQKMIKAGLLHFEPQILDEKRQKYYYTNFTNIQDFGVSGDDCTLETRIKNAPKVPEGTCMNYGVQLFGKEGTAMYQLTPQGCLRWLGLEVGNTYFGGKAQALKIYKEGVLQPFVYQDLSSFLLPEKFTEEWHILKMKIKNQVVYYYINDKLIETLPFKGKIGIINRLKIYFKGSGWVDWIRLRNGAGEEVYFEDFNDANNPAKPKI
jgi:hypothetical protein